MTRLFRAILQFFAGTSEAAPDAPEGGETGSTAPAGASDPPRDRAPAPLARADSAQTTALATLDEDEDAPWWQPVGTPVLRADTGDELNTPTDRTLRDFLSRVVQSPDLDLPRLPQVTAKALNLLRGDSVDYRQLAKTIQEDPVLSAEVLRMANSVAFRGVQEITRLDAAFTRLGQRNLRSLILATNVRTLSIRVGGPEKSRGEEIWKRSLASAVIMARLSGRYQINEEEAFLVGLLHDIGELALLRVVHDYQKNHGKKVPRQVFDQLSRQWHEHLGLRLADEWNLPSPLPMLIGQHHAEPGADDPLRIYKRLIEFSEVCAAMLGYSPYVPYDFFNLKCTQELGITDCASMHVLLDTIPFQLAERMQSF